MKMRMLATIVAASLFAPLAAAQPDPSGEPPGQGGNDAQVPAAQDEGVEGAAVQAAVARADGTTPPVLFHLAGYADVTYVNTRGGDSSGLYTLAPILHVQLGDRLLVEAEFEMEGNDSGERETGVEYATISWLINDQAALVVGKFLSPAGYFFQNLHPSWINRLASVPAGFGHGGAAPLTDVGVQIRGGRTFDNGQHVNYAIYYANGPRLGLEDMEDLDLDAEGTNRNPDGKRVVGGRLGWMPAPNLELGVSAITGDVVLDAEGMVMEPEPSRSYRVAGMDAVWRPVKALELRGEWIRQSVGAAAGSIVPDDARWRAWYVQGAYRFGTERWEAVLRYGDSDSPHGESTFTQTAIGLNFLYRPHRQVKLTWEINDSDDAEASADRLLLQLAYGF